MFSRGTMLGGGGMSEGFEVSSKRQRMIDQEPYFSGSSGFGPYSGLGTAMPMPYHAGQPRVFPVVRLRGLPFNCSESDICEFFAGLDVVDALLVQKQGRFSGEGFVVFRNPMQVDFALQRDRQNMGRRYIEVFRCKKQDYYNAVAAEVGEAKVGDDAAPPPSYSKGSSFAELNEVLTRELAEDGYSGVEVRVTPMRTEIIIRATRTQNVLGEKGRRIRELTSVVQKRFNFPEGTVELYAEKVNNRGLCAIAQAESLRYKLLGGLAVRRACYGVLRFIMESGAKGCEVIVSGKLRAQRAKSMKFKDGYMISSGQPVNEYIDRAVRHVLLRQGVLGIKVKIMLDWDPKGKQGPTKPLPDLVTIHTPKDEEDFSSKPIIGNEVEILT